MRNCLSRIVLRSRYAAWFGMNGGDDGDCDCIVVCFDSCPLATSTSITTKYKKKVKNLWNSKASLQLNLA